MHLYQGILLIILFIVSISTYAQTIDFKWKPLKEASHYRFQIRNSEGAILLDKETEKDHFPVELKPGTYEKRLIVYNKLGEEITSNWMSFNVLSKKPHKKARLKWKKIDLASSYKIEVIDEKGKAVYSKELKNNELMLPLLPGKYKKRLSVYNKLGELSAKTDWTPLNIQDSTNPELSPEEQQVLKKEEKKLQRKEMEAYSDNYQYEILKRSAVFPGWGQVYAGSMYNSTSQRIRGYFYMGAFVLSGLGYAYALNQFQKNSQLSAKLMPDLILTYSIPSSDTSTRKLMALRGISNVQSEFSNLSSVANAGNISLGIMGGIYLIQLIDALYLNIFYNGIEALPVPAVREGFKIDFLKTSYPGNIKNGFFMYYNFNF
ncbi:MAG: hypothetical protein H7A25_12325 [Leptospiraceae bacterium]|nr:hypothetical protein [Leptospiraceae bacterium]